MAQAPTLNSGISLLDQAQACRVAGDVEPALRLAVAILEDQGEEVGAALLIAEMLAETDAEFSKKAADALVDIYINRGDLPHALVASTVIDRAGGSSDKAVGRIASAFSKDSKRVKDISPAPPPLPSGVEIDKDLKHAKGEGLRKRATLAADEAIADWSNKDKPDVPRLPLFSALKTSELTPLLRAFSVRNLEEGGAVIEQGEEGTEAFVVVNGMTEAFRVVEGEELRLAALGPGAIFGEMALVSSAPRAASIRAVEPTQLLVIDRDSLENRAKKTPAIAEHLSRFCRDRMVSNLVSHSPILAAVHPEERGALIRGFDRQSFESGESLMTAGEEGPGVFLIASGSVSVFGTDSDGDRIRVAELGPGDVVGEISLVLRKPATADVIADHFTVALLLSRDKFQEAIKEHPGLLNELYDVATRREEELKTVVAQESLGVSDAFLL